MEFLVTMTTRVPSGTPDSAVDEIRAREAARSRALAAERHLLRLWRPPLAPGEWRTLGLFAADDAEALETVLASMPLRVWRTDEVTALAPHRNDPNPPVSGGAGAPEFFTEFSLPDQDGPDESFDKAVAGEAVRTRELAGQGHLVRLWALPKQPGVTRALGLWRAQDGAELQAILGALPLAAWLTVRTTPLTRHPNDPATAAGL